MGTVVFVALNCCKSFKMMENNDVEMLDLDFKDTDIDELNEKQHNNYVFIDVQGFKTSRNRFMCKEFCLVDGDYIYHALVKSPYSFSKMQLHYKRQALWLINHYHKLEYDCGNVHINDLKKHILPKIQGKTILVKGLEKISWLKDIFRETPIDCENIEDLDDIDLYPKKQETYEMCSYHKRLFGWRGGPCSMSKTLMMQAVTKDSLI